MNKISRKIGGSILATAMLIAPVSILQPTKAQAAGEYVTLSSFSGHSGNVIQVSGGNFLPNEALSIYGGQKVGTVTAMSDANGSFGPTAYTIPTIASGALPITVIGGSETASNSFYVQPYLPAVTLSSGSATPFSSITVSGTGYMPGENVVISVASATVSATAASDGSFKGAVLTIPNVAAGTQKVTAVGGSSAATATGYLYVNGFYASVSPSASYLLPGQTLFFNGSGFASGEAVLVTIGSSNGSVQVANFNATSDGSFKNAGGIVLPVSQAGQTIIYTVTGQTSQATGTVSVSIGSLNPLLSLSDYYLVPGTAYTASVSGFLAGEKVQLNQGATMLATATADSSGAAAFKGLIFPVSSAASLGFTATGRTSAVSATASVTVGQYHPYASVDNSYATPGTLLTVSGGGFAPGEHISLAVGGVVNADTAVADSFGKIANVRVTMPTSTATDNTSSIILTGTYGEAPLSIGLTVAPFLTQLSPTDFYPTGGELVTFWGTGYAPGEQVTLTQGSTVIGTNTVEKNGVVGFMATIPYGSTGVTYTATGAFSQVPASVTLGIAAFQPNVSFSTYYGVGGSPITISGTGFAPSEQIELTWNATDLGGLYADSKGNFSVSGNVPFGKVGPKIFTATGAKSAVVASATFSQSGFQPNVSFSAFYAQGGAPITLTGTGFAANEQIELTWNATDLGGLYADSKGNFSVSGNVPFGSPGPKIFTATGSISGVTASATFTQAVFAAYTTLSSYYGVGGSPITIKANGFVANEVLDFNWDGIDLGTINADSKGSLTVTGSVPFGTAGDKIFTITGKTSGAITTSTYTVAPSYVSLQLASYAGAPGTAITFIGSGYLPGEKIDVSTDRTSGTVYTFTADLTGSFHSAGYLVPTGSAKGNLSLTVIGEHSLTPRSIVFYVTGN